MKSVLSPVDFQVIHNWIAQKQQVAQSQLSQFTRAVQSLGNEFMCEWDGNTFYMYKNGKKEDGMQFIIGDDVNELKNVQVGEMVDLSKRLTWIENNFVPASELQAEIGANRENIEQNTGSIEQVAATLLTVVSTIQTNQNNIQQHRTEIDTHQAQIQQIQRELLELAPDSQVEQRQYIQMLLGAIFYTGAQIDQMHGDINDKLIRHTDVNGEAVLSALDRLNANLQTVYSNAEPIVFKCLYTRTEFHDKHAELDSLLVSIGEQLAFYYN